MSTQGKENMTVEQSFVSLTQSSCTFKANKNCNRKENPVTKSQESKEPWLKCRHVAVFLTFAAEFYLYALRMTMGVSIVAMVNNTALSTEERTESESCSDLKTNETDASGNSKTKDGTFLWPPEVQGFILGCSFLCYAIATAPAAQLTNLFGGKKVLFWSCFISSFCTFLSPFAAWYSVNLLIVVQGISGLAQGGYASSLSTLVANWCPKQERGLSFTFVLTGMSWGAVLGSYISGLLCQTTVLGGWPLAFFFFGGSGIFVSLIIGHFLYDNPGAHPKISEGELKYILDNQETVLTQKRSKTPWSRLFTSIPIYALAYGYFGQMWALSHFLSAHPTFLGTILHYPIAQNGLFSALPFLLQLLIALCSSWTSTLLINKNYMTVDTARKFWNFMSCLGYSMCLLGIYFAGCNRPVIIVISIISLACTGFGYAGCWISSTDLSPTFSASVNAIASTLGYTSNFLMPVVVGILTNGNQTMEQWNKINFISIAVVLSSGIFYVLFGSANVQPWNEVQEDSGEVEKSRF